MTRPVKSRFITVEGIDGAGKSTHLAGLVRWFGDRAAEVVSTREPGGTELAESLRALFLAREMDALTEILLVFAARRDHLQRVIEPALARGAVVLCDRFTDATFAYQGGGRGFDAGVLAQLETWVQQGRQPDMTLWFDVDPQIAASRRSAARAADRLEQLDLAFFGRVADAYRQRFEADPTRIVRIQADREPAAVWAQIEDMVRERFG